MLYGCLSSVYLCSPVDDETWPKYLLREAFKSHLIIPSLMMEAARLPGHSIYLGRQPSLFFGHSLSKDPMDISYWFPQLNHEASLFSKQYSMIWQSHRNSCFWTSTLSNVQSALIRHGMSQEVKAMSTALYYNSTTAFNHRQTRHSITLEIMLQSLVNTQINQNIVVVIGCIFNKAAWLLGSCNVKDRWEQHPGILPLRQVPALFWVIENHLIQWL